MSANIKDVVRDLTKLVGPTSVKIVSGASDYGDELARWIAGTKKPSMQQERQLRTALELVNMFKDPKDAKNWFRSENTPLDKNGRITSPCVAISRGYFHEARTSARHTIASMK